MAQNPLAVVGAMRAFADLESWTIWMVVGTDDNRIDFSAP
jgi:hypothetical protein